MGKTNLYLPMRKPSRRARLRRKNLMYAIDGICFIGFVLMIGIILNKHEQLYSSYRALHPNFGGGIILNKDQKLESLQSHRALSVNLGGGDCKWTGAEPIQVEADTYGTLLASYPASGMRVTWQQTSALTGLQVRDDFFSLHLPKIGLVKTQYPHYEGIWSYGSNLDQVILLVRNPRWAIPSYHTLISEIEYAHSWELAYEELPNVFTQRPPLQDWTRWRDYRFADEIHLWGLFIDFYMEGGSKYWFQYDFERNGQWPFRLRNETEKPWPKDLNCVYNLNCIPKTIISYENLINQTKGPDELRKIAAVLRDKPGMTVIEDEAIDCVWEKTWTEAPEPSNNNRDLNSLPRTAYKFTLDQMNTIQDKLNEYKTKYSSGSWASDINAQFLVQMLEEHLDENKIEVADLEANPGPTPSPDPSYFLEIKNWYSSLGKGSRYDKAKIQQMGIWEEVKHFYNDDDTITTDANETSNTSNSTRRQ